MDVERSVEGTVKLPLIGNVDKKIVIIGAAILGLLVVLYIMRTRASA